MPLPLPGVQDDVVASIRIDYHANGEISVKGNIGDKVFALGMLDQARDAVKHQLRPEDRKQLIVPARDVEVVQHPDYPTRPAGDMK